MWWFDTKERTWSVKRTSSPGYIDTRHFFKVNYTIEGDIVGTWYVSTCSGELVSSNSKSEIRIGCERVDTTEK